MPNTNYHGHNNNHRSNQRMDESDTSNPDIFLKKFSVCSTLYQNNNTNNKTITSLDNTSTIKKRAFTFIENENNQRISSSVSSNNESDIIR